MAAGFWIGVGVERVDDRQLRFLVVRNRHNSGWLPSLQVDEDVHQADGRGARARPVDGAPAVFLAIDQQAGLFERFLDQN